MGVGSFPSAICIIGLVALVIGGVGAFRIWRSFALANQKRENVEQDAQAAYSRGVQTGIAYGHAQGMAQGLRLGRSEGFKRGMNSVTRPDFASYRNKEN